MNGESHELTNLTLSHEKSLSTIAISKLDSVYSDVFISGNWAWRWEGWGRNLGASVIVEQHFEIGNFGYVSVCG
jgi:hypothetical protein